MLFLEVWYTECSMSERSHGGKEVVDIVVTFENGKSLYIPLTNLIMAQLTTLKGLHSGMYNDKRVTLSDRDRAIVRNIIKNLENLGITDEPPQASPPISRFAHFV